MTTTTFNFSVFSLAQLSSAGTGSTVNCGDKFTMPASTSISMSVRDDDRTLSGDGSSWWNNEQATDGWGQTANIVSGGKEIGNCGQIYAESYFWVTDQNGKWYVLIEIEQEGSSQKFYTFHNGYGVPEAGAQLCIQSQCDVTSNWIDYGCLTANAPQPEPGEICGRFTFDADGNNNEWNDKTCSWDQGLDGKKVQLLDEHGNVVAETTTDHSGAYKFVVAAGKYQVKFPQVDGTVFSAKDSGVAEHYDSDADANGLTSFIHVASGQKVCDIDAGVKPEPKGEVCGRFFLDSDHDGTEWNAKTCSWESGVEGKVVQLLDKAGNVVAETTTAHDGTYSFSVAPGEYRVKFPSLDGFDFTHKDVGDYRTDSDAYADGFTDFFCVVAGQKLCDVDAGVKEEPLGHISGRLTFDADCNDNEYNDETCSWDEGVDGQKVQLLDEQGNVVAETTTDHYGNYKFSVPAGKYQVKFPLLDGYEFSAKDSGVAEHYDSDADATGLTDVIHLSSGQKITDVDAGLKQCADDDCITIEAEDMYLKGYCVEKDASASGGKAVKGLICDYASATTFFKGKAGEYDLKLHVLDESDGQGHVWIYVNGSLVKAVTLNQDNGGDGVCDPRVWSEISVDNLHLNYGDKITIVGYGKGGEYVRLDKIEICKDKEPLPASLGDFVFFDANKDGVFNAADGDTALAGATVELLNANGDVVATQVTGADGSYLFENLQPGDYSVRFTAPDGSGLVLTTPSAAAADAVNNDSDAGAGGVTGVVTLGEGEVERDVDAGFRDPGTASISGRVFHDSDDDSLDVGEAEAGAGGVTVQLLAGGVVIATTTTAADGSYSFTGLDAGDYVVQFPTDVNGKVLVDPNVGVDDTIDSDADQGTGQTGTITLAIGENKKDVDAGVEDPGTASLGDTVFLDNNGNGVFDAGDAAAVGVLVELLNADGTATGLTDVTDANGEYLFDGLDAGDYRVRFGTLAGFTFTTASAVAADAVNNDSDADANGLTGVISLSIGEAERDVDAGLVDINDAPIAVDDAGKTCANELLSIDLLANDSDPEGDAISVVSISDEDETAGVGGTITLASGATVTLNADGTVAFDGKAAHADLLIGEQVIDSFVYTLEDARGGQATGAVDVTVCGATETIGEFYASAPTSGVYKVQADNEVLPVGDSAYDLQLDGTGDARFDGVVFDQAYCLSFRDPLSAAETFADAGTFTAVITDGNDASVFNANQIGFANQKSAAENLDLVNWILAQDYENDPSGQFGAWEVQLAIWDLTDTRANGGRVSSFVLGLDPAYGQQADVNFIVNQAIANGEGYMPGNDGIVSLIVDPSPATADNSQPFIIALKIDDFDCLCA